MIARRAALVIASIASIASIAVGCQPPREPGPPVTIVTETSKLRRGDPLPETSAIFDGARVHLRGVRGEVLAFQVVRRGAGEMTASLAIDAGLAIHAWRVDDVRAVRASTDMYGPSAGNGDYPDRLVPVEAATVIAPRVALFELAIATDAVAGRHRGALTIDDRVIPIEVEVLPIAIAPIGSGDTPGADGAPWVWAYYNASELARGLGLVPGSPEAWAAEDQYRALFRGYGVYATPELTLDDADRRAPAIRGARFVPVLLPRGKAAIQAAARGWKARLEGSGQHAFAIPIDEPHTLIDTIAARVIAQWLDDAGGGVWLAVTDNPSWLYGNRAHVLIAPGAPGSGPAERRWTYNGAPPQAGSMIVDTDGAALRTWGWIAWRWDVPLWYVWDAIYWRDRHNAKRRGEDAVMMDPARDAQTFDDGGDHGNLDGVLAYPDVHASLRLVALRRGVTDRALLDALARCAGRPAAEAIARSIMPTALAAAGLPPAPGAWPTGEQAWEAARGRVLDGLVGCASR